MSLRDLATKLLDEEQPLIEDYETLAKNAVTAVEKELTSYLLRFQKQQVSLLQLFQGELPNKFLSFGKIVNTQVKFRKGPGGQHPLIGELASGQPCIVMDFNGYWAHVQLTDGRRGYVFKDYVVAEDGRPVDRPEWQKKA